VVGKLFSELKTRAVFDTTLIAVMADHGEAFGEHEKTTTVSLLYDETIHVPMLFKLPRRHAAMKVEAPVGLVDATPSILQGGSFAGSRAGAGQVPNEIHGNGRPSEL
jgi:arylsulfatase A-like enzyme